MAATIPHTTSDGERAAKTLFDTDWDGNGETAVYLPRDVAVQLLTARGWTPGPGVAARNPNLAARGTGWVSPNGARYWELDEALAVALVAEVA